MAAAWDTFSQEESWRGENLALLCRKNTVWPHKLEHCDILSKILQANEI